MRIFNEQPERNNPMKKLIMMAAPAPEAADEAEPAE